MALRGITVGRILVGDTAADRPPAGAREAQWPGVVFFALDGSGASVTDYSAPNTLGWATFPGGGGGGITINTAAPLAGGGVGVLFNLSFSIAGESNGDLLVYSGGTWTRLPAGTPGFVLTMVAGVPTWAAAGGGGITIASGGPPITVSPGPAYSIGFGFAGEAVGDLAYRSPAGWVRLPIGTPGQIPTVNLFGPNNELFYRSLSSQEPAIADFSSGVSWDFRFGYAAQAQGDLCYSSGAAPAAWSRLPIGNAGDVLTVQSGTPVWLPQGAQQNVTLYVAGVSGNDANDGLTPGTAVQTVARVMELLPGVATGSVTVNFAPEPVTETVLPSWFLPWPKGSQTARAVLFDAPLVETLPAQPIVNGNQGFGTVFGDVTPTVPLVPNAHDGQILEWLSGPMLGQRYRIAANAAALVTICGQFQFAPGPGDIFRIVQESVTITFPPPAGGFPAVIAGFGLVLSGIDVRVNGNLLIVYGQLAYNCASFGSTSGSLICAQIGALVGANPVISNAPSIGFNFEVGPNFGHGAGGIDGARFDVRGYRVFASGGLSFFKNCQPLLTNGYHDVGAGGVEVGLCSALEATSLVGFNNIGQAFINLFANSTGVVTSILAANNSGDGVRVDSNSSLLAFDLTGGGNAGYGLRAQYGAIVRVPDAAAVTLITGALGDVQVGGNAAPATWAQIAGGLAVDVLDLAAPVPQLCSVSL